MSITPSFGDRGAHLGNGMYEEFKTVYCYFCDGLFLVGEDGFWTWRMVRICKLSGRYQDPAKNFPQLRAHLYTNDVKFKDR